jgi:hypothetical protein
MTPTETEKLADDLRKCLQMINLERPSGGWISGVILKAAKELEARPAPAALSAPSAPEPTPDDEYIERLRRQKLWPYHDQ